MLSTPVRALALLACGVLPAGCGDSPPDDPPHLPVISDVGGPRMAHPQLVPIFFSDDPDAATLTSFNQWIVTSRWLAEVGAEYGVGAGAVLGVVQKTVPAPDAITDPEIVDQLYQGIADGSFPPPPGGDPRDVLYDFYFPEHTKVTGVNFTSCVELSGYHGSARRSGVELSYAVVATCFDFTPILTEVEGRELVTSHEVIEAATDPLPSNNPAFQLIDPTSSWHTLGEEVGDLCEGTDASIWRDSGFVAQRSWSNAAALAGDPCVPNVTGGRYFNVVAGAGALPRIAPGGKQTIRLAGWSTVATPDWNLFAVTGKGTTATLTLAADRLNAGKSTTLGVEVPATAARGTALRMLVFSAFTQTDFQALPLLALVDDPCASFAGCEACSSHRGCGFCATTGRCEAQGASGSAESSCPASSFATWPGSCPGLCAAHSGSCADCAGQPGCGWCAAGGAGQCLEASHDFAHPEAATCGYADWSFTPDYCAP